MPLNESLISAVADNVADWGNECASFATALKTQELPLNQIIQLMDNIILDGERLAGEAQKLREELANPTG